ncbi:MAG: nitroreductase family deazaflavin-dependent oxidoreductase [Deltaproteobacteria bacterium]|jgi:deazaflavin-dependent oxidoreductase (nitroreductase family)|nr:nitroreductase family deazaflavin-dependent oxidoreductase [Deltaproteobacteria bacterium]MBW2384892.1 nitroreductase family deazaflavin-dependent oxidoreductase [Deltaproteobacteria bacterium]MBW2697410.1 nitroreductase family deazaflavin-dependent oxidoreductase [Deltaproteobacteria bacterium]
MSQHDLSALERSWNCHLTTLGRKSGEPREVTIWFALGPDTVYLTGSASGPHWCRNVRANGAVELRIGGQRLSGTARVVDDPDDAAAIRQRFRDRYLLARLSHPFGGYTESIAVVVDLD